MSSLSAVLRQVREKTVIEANKLARITGIDEERIHEIEGGSVPGPEELDSYALAFGVSVQGLLRGDALTSPMTTLLFRAEEYARWGDVETLTDTDALRVFGDFLRATSELAELDGLNGRAYPKELPCPPAIPKDEKPPYGADIIATWLRAELGLGQEPVDPCKLSSRGSACPCSS